MHPPHKGVATIALLLATLAGCHSIPARFLNEPAFLDGLRSNQEPINFIRLRQDPPPVYLLAPRDVLGIYIERVLGEPEIPPPVHFPENGDLPPAVGFPIPVREDGAVSLPLVPPLRVEGLTLAQAERVIRDAYTVDRQLLPPGQDRVLVTLIKPRTYHVLVIREDSRLGSVNQAFYGKGELLLGSGNRGETYALELAAYENDVLHALAESGGLPGVDAKNELTILRGAFDDADDLNQYASSDFVDDNGSLMSPEVLGEVLTPNPNITKIPLRSGPYSPPVELAQDEIILDTGDIVFIESRDAEVFYTGGLLNGGQFPIPRDYDLDVLGGIAMAGGAISTAAGGFGTVAIGGGGGGVGAIFPPTRLLIVRTVDGRQRTIRVNVKKALRDPSQRLLVQPNDFLLLQYTEIELAMNIIFTQLRFDQFYRNNR